MSGVATCSPPLKRRRGSPDLHQEENWHELQEENKKLKSEIDILKKKVKACEKSVQEKATSTVEPSASDGERMASEDPLHQCQKSLGEYKAKSENLELKIKIMSKKFAAKEKKYQEQITMAHYIKDSHVEKYKKVALERESLLKKVRELESIAAKNESNKPAPLNRACDQCVQLAEKLRLCKLDKEATEKTATYLKDDLQNARNEMSALNHRVKSLMLEKKKLESELENEKCWKYAQRDPSILKFTENLKIKAALEENNCEGLENESKSEEEVDSVKNFENSSFHIISKNESTCTTPSVKNLTNGTGKTLKAFCKAEDEAEMFSQSYLGDVQGESPAERMKEFQRRNTLCLPHLKSAYPLELNTTPSQDKYFMPPTSLKRQRLKESTSTSHIVKRCKVFKHTESSKGSRTESIPWKSGSVKQLAIDPSGLVPGITRMEKGSIRWKDARGRMHIVSKMMKLQKSKIK